MTVISFQLPDVGEGITEARMVQWLVKEGDFVEEDQPVCEIQTDKAVVELPAPCKGEVIEKNWEPGDLIAVGETLLTIQAIEQTKKKTYPVSPSTRRLAKELGIDLDQVIGTGKGGRILDEDVKRLAIGKEIDVETLTTVRKNIGDKLLTSLKTRPHATHFDQVNAEGLVKFRNHLNKEESITYTPILLKMVAETLKKHPQWNAHFDEENQTIKRYSSIAIGLATHTDQGLLVPVIHRVEEKSLVQLSNEIREVVDSIRRGKMKADSAKGSTFTVSNVGSLGGMWATPIIQPPEVGILAIHPIKRNPIVQEDGQIVAQWQINLSLTFDHRIFDGVDAIRFTQTLASYIRNPLNLLKSLK